MTIYHPAVLAELEKRQSEAPGTCHKPLGLVHFTAQKPNPRWCARPLGHAGPHMPVERYEQYKSLATARQNHKRAHDNA